MEKAAANVGKKERESFVALLTKAEELKLVSPAEITEAGQSPDSALRLYSELKQIPELLPSPSPSPVSVTSQPSNSMILAAASPPASAPSATQQGMEGGGVKVVLLGNATVGKTSLAVRWVHDSFNSELERSIGASFFSKTVILSKKQSVRIALWDTAGQDKYRALAPLYYRDSIAAVLVFDLSDLTAASACDDINEEHNGDENSSSKENNSSLEGLRYWTQELRKNLGEAVVLVIVGNKCDLVGKGVSSSSSSSVSKMTVETNTSKTTPAMNKEKKTQLERMRKQVKQFANECRALYFETSAATGYGVNDMFTSLISRIAKENKIPKSCLTTTTVNLSSSSSSSTPPSRGVGCCHH